MLCSNLVALVSLAIVVVASDTYFSGTCQQHKSKVNIITGLVLEQFSGAWYEIASYRSSTDGDCKRINLTVKDETSLVETIVSRNITSSLEFSSQDTICEIPNEEEEARFFYCTGEKKAQMEFRVVSTDYDFAVLWGCKDMAASRSLHTLNIIARKPYLPFTVSLIVRDVLKDNQFDDRKIVDTLQDYVKCGY